MLEQVWKNVVGQRFPYEALPHEIRGRIPRGNPTSLYTFGLLIDSVERGLGHSVSVLMNLDEEGLIRFSILEFDNSQELDLNDFEEQDSAKLELFQLDKDVD